ncbi:MAG TPA: hypothetical protein VG712_02250 [Gemmatimonadales bacterium]|nr:hypothetical protein [Gemmatimonadales bacterium]
MDRPTQIGPLPTAGPELKAFQLSAYAGNASAEKPFTELALAKKVREVLEAR